MPQIPAPATELIARIRAKHAEAAETLLKLEQSLALRVLHPELEKHSLYNSRWEQANISRCHPRITGEYVLVVNIEGKRHEHQPEDVPEPLLRMMPNYVQYMRKLQKQQEKQNG